MPNFSVAPDIVAGTTNANIFAGSAFEFIGRASRVAIAMVAEAGAVAGDMLATIQFGPEVQLEEGNVSVELGAGQGAKLPEDILVDDVAAAGDRLVGRVTNTSAGNLHCMCKVRIIPLV